jgi:type I restriction enzyme, S subunit
MMLAMAKWHNVTLGSICSPKQHRTVSMSELTQSGYPVYGANGQIGFYHSFTHDSPTIAITCRGATCGTVNVVPPFSYITGNAMALDDLDEKRVDMKYLASALRARGFNDVISGSAQPQITRQPLLTIAIPLPPLNEQRRIGAILDQADMVRQKRSITLDMLERLANSVYRVTFESEKFSIGPLSELVEIRASLVDPCEHAFASLPHIGPEHIQRDNGRLLSYRSAEADGVTSGKYLFDGDCVLYSKIRPYLNKVALAPGRGLCSADMYPLRPREGRATREFIWFLLRQSTFLDYALGRASRTNIPKLNREQLLSFPAILPSFSLQVTFSRMITEILQCQASAQSHAAKCDMLFESLQHDAFSSGKLNSDANVVIEPD